MTAVPRSTADPTADRLRSDGPPDGPSDPSSVADGASGWQSNRAPHMKSASEIAEETGDYTLFDQIVADFIREERSKVARLARQLSATRCRRCDHLHRHHLTWPGPCSLPYCSCPGPEPA